MSDYPRAEHPTLYEYAGGHEAIWRLADVQYRRCLTDPVLIEIFGTDGHPGHVDHLADWLTEVLGGKRLYTKRHGGHGPLLTHHANLRIQERHRTRFVQVFMEAADEVGPPDNQRFRQRLLDYLQWGSKIAQDVSQPGADTATNQPVPVCEPDRPRPRHSDQRLLVIEPEFASVLKAANREMSTLSQVGPLEPTSVNPDTGYRLYTLDQVPTAQVILRFRELDMPVREVKSLLQAAPAARDRGMRGPRRNRVGALQPRLFARC